MSTPCGDQGSPFAVGRHRYGSENHRLNAVATVTDSKSYPGQRPAELAPTRLDATQPVCAIWSVANGCSKRCSSERVSVKSFQLTSLQHHIPKTFVSIFVYPWSSAHKFNATVAISSTSGTAKPSFVRSTDFRYARHVSQASTRM